MGEEKERPNTQATGGEVSTEVEKFRELVTSTEESIQGKKEAAARQLAAAQRLQDALLAAQKVSPLLRARFGCENATGRHCVHGLLLILGATGLLWKVG